MNASENFTLFYIFHVLLIIYNFKFKGHVHFAENVEPHNLIQVKQDGDNKVQVHVGFLQTNHKYEINFDIPNLSGGEDFTACEKVTKDVKLDVTSVQPTGKIVML